MNGVSRITAQSGRLAVKVSGIVFKCVVVVRLHTHKSILKWASDTFLPPRR